MLLPLSVRPAIFIALLLATVLPVAGTNVHEKSNRLAPKIRTIVIKDLRYQPAHLIVRVGETAEWKNQDMFEHTVTATNNSFDSGVIEPGASWKMLAKRPGTYKYTCMLHPNMQATLTVLPSRRH